MIVCEDSKEYDPEGQITIGRAVGRCPNCSSVIEDGTIMQAAKLGKLPHSLHAIASSKEKEVSRLEFRLKRI